MSNNFNLQNYSLTVRNAIEYINLNLNMELSLSSISEVLDKNPSFLSNQFKKGDWENNYKAYTRN